MTASVRHPRRIGVGVAAWEAWSRFWFTPIPAARLGLLRIWLFGFVVVDVLLRKEVSVAMGSTPRLFWHPVGATWFLDQLGVGPPSAVAIRLVQIALAATAVAAMIGYRYRLTAPIAALLYLYWQCLGQSWGEMKHARVTIVLGLLFLATVAASQRRSIDAIRARARRARLDRTVVDRPVAAELSVDGAWAVRAVQVSLAVLYFLSGYSKLRSIGIQWAWGDTLKQALQDKASSGETTTLGYWSLDHAWILVAFQVVALAWEVGFPLIFFRRFRYPVIIVGLLFNIGLWITVRIEFFGVLACFAAFLSPRRLGAAAAPMVGPPARRHPGPPRVRRGLPALRVRRHPGPARRLAPRGRAGGDRHGASRARAARRQSDQGRQRQRRGGRSCRRAIRPHAARRRRLGRHRSRARRCRARLDTAVIRRAIAGAVGVAALLVACGDDDAAPSTSTSMPTTAAPPTTTAAPSTAAPSTAAPATAAPSAPTTAPAPVTCATALQPAVPTLAVGAAVSVPSDAITVPAGESIDGALAAAAEQDDPVIVLADGDHPAATIDGDRPADDRRRVTRGNAAGWARH